MKQKLFIFGFLFVMIAVLVGLNAATYTQKEKTPDSEFAPNRSTFNPGATGTAAYYSLLAETGRRVTRWQQPPAALITAGKNAPKVFVIVGSIRRDFTAPESEELLRWVANGGRLVLIDRDPPDELAVTTANWKITLGEQNMADLLSVDSTDQPKMTAETPAVRPVQPSIFTANVNAVQPSRYASSVAFTRFVDRENKPAQDDYEDGPPPRSYNEIASPSQVAPVAHFAHGDKNLLVDAPFGLGRVVILSDPYIISNAGISLVDNAQLAVNLVTVSDGVVAFDEFHQGYGSDQNRFLQFFEGTPVVPIFLQSLLLVGLVFFSQSRRFARPVPEPEPDRLSKLEYVAAMAELQSRTRAFDLAIENIYHDFRRRTTRHLGLDNSSAQNSDISARVAERTGLTPASVEDTLHKCEEIIRGEPTNKSEVVLLTAELREIEQKLGLTRAARTRI